MVLSSSDPAAHRKPCTLCSTPRDVLIRCQIDDSGKWHLVCPGKCWRDVSGGVEDGDADHPLYRYGGAWKNRWADVTAKKPASVKKRQKRAAASQPVPWSMAEGTKYTVNDRVAFDNRLWICRKSHKPREGEEPPSAHHLWKENDSHQADEDNGERSQGSDAAGNDEV